MFYKHISSFYYISLTCFPDANSVFKGFEVG